MVADLFLFNPIFYVFWLPRLHSAGVWSQFCREYVSCSYMGPWLSYWKPEKWILSRDEGMQQELGIAQQDEVAWEGGVLGEWLE